MRYLWLRGAGALLALLMGGSCRGEPEPAFCNDGVIEGDEQCDLSDLGGWTCASVTGTYSGGVLRCTAQCTFDTSGCLERCGDGVIDPGEACDEGAANSDTRPDACRTSCALPSCGDGVVDALSGEACDDGAANADGVPDACRSTCQAPTCGDGVVDRFSGEVCDLGPENSRAPDAACRPTCEPPSCGDGVVDGLAGEECDGPPGPGTTCLGLGAGLGLPGCTAECGLDVQVCWTCGDGVCDPWEGLGNCATDCAATTVSVAADHACAVLVDGSARCWGSNAWGQLGDGTHGNRALPVRPVGVTGLASIEAGGLFTCAVTREGAVGCWGYGGHGELGTGAPATSAVPLQVSHLGGVTSVAAQKETYVSVPGFEPGPHRTCAVTDDGAVWCWGRSLEPAPVSGLTGVAGVAVSFLDACAVRTDGSVACWGNNAVGQLGNGTTAGSPLPVPVIGIKSVVQVAIGGLAWPDSAFLDAYVATTVCALDVGGSVWCWGANDHGQLGDGATHRTCDPGGERIDCSPTPVRVQGLSDVVSIAASADQLCARRRDGTVWCWGSGVALPVSSLGRAVDLAMGGGRACIVDVAGAVWCWSASQAPTRVGL